jgi:hypothetical protein
MEASPHHRAPTVVRVLAVPLVAIGLLAGLWVVSGLLAPGYDSSIWLGVAWFVAAGAALRRLVRTRRELKLPVRATFLLTAAAVGAAFAWTTLRDDEVDERIAMAGPGPAASQSAAGRERSGDPQRRNVELASGELDALAHDASGTARVIELAEGGRVVTLSDGFEVDNGPDLRVYLTTGDGESAGDFVDLGGLKGNKGNQQYRIPSGVDLDRRSTLSIWCRALRA